MVDLEELFLLLLRINDIIDKIMELEKVTVTWSGAKGMATSIFLAAEDYRMYRYLQPGPFFTTGTLTLRKV